MSNAFLEDALLLFRRQKVRIDTEKKEHLGNKPENSAGGNLKKDLFHTSVPLFSSHM